MRRLLLIALCSAFCIPHSAFSQDTPPPSPHAAVAAAHAAVDALAEQLRSESAARDLCILERAAALRELDAERSAFSVQRSAFESQISNLQSQIAALSPPPLLPFPSPATRLYINPNERIDAAQCSPGDWALDLGVYTGLNAPPATIAACRTLYDADLAALRARGVIVGLGLSGTNVSSTASKVPSEFVTWESWGSDYHADLGLWPGEPWRTILDIRDPPTARRMVQLLGERFAGWPVAFIDNGPDLNYWINGDAKCRFIRMLADEGTRRGCRLWMNVYVCIGTITRDDPTGKNLRTFIDSVKGHALVTEVPWHKNMKAGAADTARAIVEYRAILDAGIPILMIETVEPVDVLAAWVKTWRKPTDPLWIAWQFNQPEPTWLRN